MCVTVKVLILTRGLDTATFSHGSLVAQWHTPPLVTSTCRLEISTCEMMGSVVQSD